jgi:hypothetical protein
MLKAKVLSLLRMVLMPKDIRLIQMAFLATQKVIRQSLQRKLLMTLILRSLTLLGSGPLMQKVVKLKRLVKTLMLKA